MATPRTSNGTLAWKMGGPPTELMRPAKAPATPSAARVEDDDAFFVHHADRYHRVRRATQSEIASIGVRRGDGLQHLEPGHVWLCAFAWLLRAADFERAG
jgi:hypothetical protein